MDSHPLGNGVIDDSTGTLPPSFPANNPPVHRAINIPTQPIPIDAPANNPPLHRAIYIPTEPMPAAVDRFLNRRMEKRDAFALGLFFASLGSLNSPRSGDHFAIALVLKFIVSLFLYSCSCFSNPGPMFRKMQVTMLVVCVGLLVLAIFLARHA